MVRMFNWDSGELGSSSHSAMKITGQYNTTVTSKLGSAVMQLSHFNLAPSPRNSKPNPMFFLSYNPLREVAFVQKRFHKDIFHNPVLMLNFCPEVGSIPTDFQTVTREMLFLVDRSGRMRGSTIDGIKDALLVAVKSLPSGSLLNVAGFGSNIKPIFPSSKPCNSETLRLACEYIQRLRADMGGTNLLAALAWMLGQPLHRGFPRQLFLFTNASVGNTGKVIELVRRQASSVRCFTFGLGSGACERLLKGLAKVSRGRAEFLSPGERLQPKLMKSLKKAIEPAVSDITIDWYVPDTMEALLSPNEIAALYPGDRLISYCTLYHIASFRDKKATVEHLSLKEHLSRRRRRPAFH
ncbi:von Willebrand factor A domain-containing protein 5B1 [Varanus komodoensis]|nr:von Willebrand factor A domain-containing protein 5B1 [Varanus komodoensis]